MTATISVPRPVGPVAMVQYYAASYQTLPNSQYVTSRSKFLYIYAKKTPITRSTFARKSKLDDITVDGYMFHAYSMAINRPNLGY